MLTLTRRPTESIIIKTEKGDINIKYLRVNKRYERHDTDNPPIMIGIEAPNEYLILREELDEKSSSPIRDKKNSY